MTAPQIPATAAAAALASGSPLASGAVDTADIIRQILGRDSRSVHVLCTVLSERVGNPDLAEVVTCIDDICEADPVAHWPAAYNLAAAARRICADTGVRLH